MAVPDQVPFNQYSASGSSDTFAYTFKILGADQLVVKLDGVTQVSGFTVSGVGNDAGGNVVFSSNPAATTLVEIIRTTPATRSTDYAPNGDLREETLDADFDRAYMALQEMQEQVDRTMKLPQGSTGSLDLDTLTPDAYLKVNSTGTAITQVPVLTPSGTFSVTPFAETLLDDADQAAMQATLDVYPKAETDSIRFGRLINVQVFSASGAGTWTKPNGCTVDSIVEVEVIGPGGNGGIAGQSASGQITAGTGGGGGAYIRAYTLASTLGSTEPVFRGSPGGLSGARSNAGIQEPTAGSDSYFGDAAYRVTAGAGNPGKSESLASGTSMATVTASGSTGLGGTSTVAGVIWTVLNRIDGQNATPAIRLSGTSAIASVGGCGHSAPLLSAFPAVTATSFESSTIPTGPRTGAGGIGSIHANNTPALSATVYFAQFGGNGLVIVRTYS